MEIFDLQDNIHASTHLLSFWASSKHQKPFKIEPKVFVPKTVPKICNNFIDTYDMVMKLCWLTYVIKMKIYL